LTILHPHERLGKLMRERYPALVYVWEVYNFIVLGAESSVNRMISLLYCVLNRPSRTIIDRETLQGGLRSSCGQVSNAARKVCSLCNDETS